jgi:hypothetical protein
MFIPNSYYRNYDRTPTESDWPLPVIFPEEPEVGVEKVPTGDIKSEEVSIDYTQENGFFKGLLYALPAGLLFWALLIWAVREFWINFGGGSVGTG